MMFHLLVFLCGAAIALQAATNAKLLSYVGNPLWVAFALFGLGFAVLLAAAWHFRAEFPTITTWLHVPWWAYLGGFVIATYAALVGFSVAKIGVISTILLIVFGQMCMSILIDYFGWFGVERVQLDIKKLSGVTLMGAGVLLVKL